MKRKTITAMLISAAIFLSACTGQGSGENKPAPSASGGDGQSTVQTGTAEQSSVPDAEPEAENITNDNNSVIYESGGELYYRCDFNLLYHIIDEKNVEPVIINNTGPETAYKDVSDPVLSKLFTGLDYSAAVGDNCFFSMQHDAYNSDNYCCIIRYDIENGTIVKSTDLYDRNRFVEFFKKESLGENESLSVAYNPPEDIFNLFACLHYGHDGYVYFINTGNSKNFAAFHADNNNFRIGRFAEDGSSIEYIGKETACAMDLYDGYIYYLDNGYTKKVTDGRMINDYDIGRIGVYRMKTDGSDKQKLCSLSIEEGYVYKYNFMRIIDDYIYFVTSGKAVNLCRIPVQGGEPEIIADLNNAGNVVYHSYCLDADAQKVYFQSITGAGSGYKINKADSGSGKSELMIENTASVEQFYQGFADIAGNYLYLNCYTPDVSNMKKNRELITDGKFTPDPVNENCLIRPLPSGRYDLSTEKFEKIYEILTFNSKAQADEFLSSADYSTVSKISFEWRESDLRY